jgi:hypothetical protein
MDPVLMQFEKFKEAEPCEAEEAMAEAVTAAVPEELTHLHVAVYRLMLAVPDLLAVDALEMVAKIGILWEQNGRGEG